jgi:hypothetical protein
VTPQEVAVSTEQLQPIQPFLTGLEAGMENVFIYIGFFP